MTKLPTWKQLEAWWRFTQENPVPRKPHKPDPVKICARMNKGWAFTKSMTIDEYKAKKDAIQLDLETLPPEQFEAKYKTWMY